MFNYLRGTLTAVDEDTVTVENNGLGWQITVPLPVQARLGSPGEEVKLYTYLAIREDSLQLYGFSAKEELDLFKLLISVSGIGPKAALAVLGTLAAAEFYQALLQEDVKTLTRVPGIGPKSARRLIVELKDKVEKLKLFVLTEEQTLRPDLVEATAAAEALAALLSLGYQGPEAQKALNAIPQGQELAAAELLRRALAYLGTI